MSSVNKNGLSLPRKSAPSILIPTALKSISSRGSHSAHTTPVIDEHSNGARRSSKRESTLAIDQKEAGHTPPPSQRTMNVTRFSDLVQDTDKKEGPINWWNLKVRMPDDNTMNILSPHRIPVPETPTTPPYIVKTPNGTRVSLLDFDVDDEKQMAELLARGVQVGDEQKQYIVTVQKEKTLLAEKEREEQLLREQTNADDTGSDSDSVLDDGTQDAVVVEEADHFDTASIAALQQAGINVADLSLSRPRSSRFNRAPRSKTPHQTPHDPLPPTSIVPLDFGVSDGASGDVLAAVGNEHRQSLQDMRLYRNLNRSKSQTVFVRTRHSLQPQMRARTLRQQNGHATRSSHANSHAAALTQDSAAALFDKSVFSARPSQLASLQHQRHSEMHVMSSSSKLKRQRSRERGRTSSRKDTLSSSTTRAARSASLGDALKKPERNLKNRVVVVDGGNDGNKRSTSSKSGKKRKQNKRNSKAKSERLSAQTTSMEMVQELPPLNIEEMTMAKSISSTSRKVRFSLNPKRAANATQATTATTGMTVAAVDKDNDLLQIMTHQISTTPTITENVEEEEEEEDDNGGDEVVVVKKMRFNRAQRSKTPHQTPHDPLPPTAIVPLDFEEEEEEDVVVQQPVEEEQAGDEDAEDSAVLHERDEQFTDDDESMSKPKPMKSAPFALAITAINLGGDTNNQHTSENENGDAGNCDEDDEDEDFDESDASDVDPEYMKHRYESSDSDSQQSQQQPDDDEVNSDDDENFASAPAPMKIGAIAMPAGANRLHLGLGIPAGLLVGADGQMSVVGSGNAADAHKHLALSPFIMDSGEAINHFFRQYVPRYYTDNPWLLSSTFEIHSYPDLKNLNLYVYKSLRSLHVEREHPTQLRKLKRKRDLDWHCKIDRIATCYMDTKLMTHVIQFMSVPSAWDNRDDDAFGADDDAHDDEEALQMHTLGFIKSTQRYEEMTTTMKTKKGSRSPAPMMPNSVTHTPQAHTPQTSGLGVGVNNATMAVVATPPMYPQDIKDDDAYYRNHVDDAEVELVVGQRTCQCGCRCCCDVHSFRASLIVDNRTSCRRTCDSCLYLTCYRHHDMLLFLLVYGCILALTVCQRLFLPLPWFTPHDKITFDPYDLDTIVLVVTGRVMLASLVCLIVSRMTFVWSRLSKRCRPCRCLHAFLQFFLRFFLLHPQLHVVVAWFGLLLPCLLHLVFAVSPSITNDRLNVDMVSDTTRVTLAVLSMLGLVLSNLGATFFSKYSTSPRSLRRPCVTRTHSVCCNTTFDVGHEQKRYKFLHLACALLFTALFYSDTQYSGVYIAVSMSLVCVFLDRVWFLYASKHGVLRTANLSVIPIDHQFNVMFVNSERGSTFGDIEPGDVFYMSETTWSSCTRPAMFFSKNSYASIGCIMRVHRTNTLSQNMERVKWNFNFLEQILDHGITPVFRGPYTNHVYSRLIADLESDPETPPRIQYLMAVDEGVAYQMEYLTYLQHRKFTKMPSPTHIIFATSSKSLFNYICSTLQFLFVEMEDLTVECKLLPSNVNLIPNVSEMVQYYKNEKRKKARKKREKPPKPQQQPQSGEQQENITQSQTKAEGDENIVITIAPDTNASHQVDEDSSKDTEDDMWAITDMDVLQEMEYDILHYLSIPHILYHHHLLTFYEQHADSKLSRTVTEKFRFDKHANKQHNNEHRDRNRDNNNNNEDIHIEMYYAGIPFVSNVLQNVCTICRIPYYTQKIY